MERQHVYRLMKRYPPAAGQPQHNGEETPEENPAHHAGTYRLTGFFWSFSPPEPSLGSRGFCATARSGTTRLIR